MELQGKFESFVYLYGCVALNWELLDFILPILAIKSNDNLHPCRAVAASSFSFFQSLWNFFITSTSFPNPTAIAWHGRVKRPDDVGDERQVFIDAKAKIFHVRSYYKILLVLYCTTVVVDSEEGRRYVWNAVHIYWDESRSHTQHHLTSNSTAHFTSLTILNNYFSSLSLSLSLIIIISSSSSQSSSLRRLSLSLSLSLSVRVFVCLFVGGWMGGFVVLVVCFVLFFCFLSRVLTSYSTLYLFLLLLRSLLSLLLRYRLLLLLLLLLLRNFG